MNITPRSLFNVILKIFGLFFLREIINTIPESFLTFVRFFSASEISPSVGVLVVELIILTFYTLLVMQLMLRTNKIIDILKLDQGFSEDEFSFEERQQNKITLTKEEVLNIALIILGGLILVNEIPDFLRMFYLYVDEKKSFYGATAPSISNMVASFAKVLLGLLILGERKRILAFFENKKLEDQATDV